MNSSDARGLSLLIESIGLRRGSFWIDIESSVDLWEVYLDLEGWIYDDFILEIELYFA